MKFSVSNLKLRILLIIMAMFFLYQAIKLLPWLLAIQKVSGDSMPMKDGLITPVAVTVFYEALCPDSKSFITKQVLPAFEKAPRLISLSLVPYGKAQTVEDSFGNISFSCQHGPVECQANKIHACAIEYIRDMRLLLRYISCMISNNVNPEYIAEECARYIMVEVAPILQCSRTKEGSELLKNYGEKTHDLSPAISFVPTVLLNDVSYYEYYFVWEGSVRFLKQKIVGIITKMLVYIKIQHFLNIAKA
ncbi:UNVERIFIED_CONTAM: hypothetical protein PYX00_000610 [Menopon gallinae]|uniref:Gamma-interferon-inducible lysosomal thiol reductase n=1 Tax=Menopon gallinae TaxID=328185 RepID=A0AAW2IB03_9NEOP